MHIALLSVANACALANTVLANGNAGVPNLQTMAIDIVTSSPLTSGTFDIVNSSTAQAAARYQATNAICADVSEEEAQSGTITITTVTSSQVTGSFDFTLDAINDADASGGDHVTGSFSAPICPALSALLTQVIDGDGGAASVTMVDAGCN
jgi:hypothetical protein